MINLTEVCVASVPSSQRFCVQLLPECIRGAGRYDRAGSSVCVPQDEAPVAGCRSDGGKRLICPHVRKAPNSCGVKIKLLTSDQFELKSAEDGSAP